LRYLCFAPYAPARASLPGRQAERRAACALAWMKRVLASSIAGCSALGAKGGWEGSECRGAKCGVVLPRFRAGAHQLDPELVDTFLPLLPATRKTRTPAGAHASAKVSRTTFQAGAVASRGNAAS
jgi:hypothetical protein